nr:LysR substrate-binding domain-containing protein [Sphingomonas sp. Y57]
MELRHLRYFLAVADTLNFTRAAEKQHTSQPSLSQQIRDLEREVGRKLFIRNSRSVKLTPAGATFAEYARRALEIIDDGMVAARAGVDEANAVRIGFLIAAEVVLFPTLLPQVRARVPRLDLSLSSMSSRQQLAALRTHSIDVAFMRPPINDPRIATIPIFEEEINVILSRNHPLIAKPLIGIEDLRAQKIIGVTDNVPGLETALSEWFARHDVKPQIVEHADNVIEYMSMARLGIGVGLLPTFANHILLDGLETRPIAAPGPRIGMVMAFAAKGLSEAAQQFVEAVSILVADRMPTISRRPTS